MKKFLIFSLLILASCSSRGLKYTALAEDNQTIIFNRGYEAISSDAEIQVICSPVNLLISKEPGLEFEIRVINNSDQPITVSSEFVKAYDAANRQLTVLSPEQLEKSAKTSLVVHSVANALGAVMTPTRYNNQEWTNKKYDDTKSAIRNYYLQKQTVLPKNFHGGSVLISNYHPRNNLIKLEVFIPEINETRRFAFALSRE